MRFVAAMALAAACTSATGQEMSPDQKRAAEMGAAALDCAILAAHSTEGSGYRPLVPNLFNFALPYLHTSAAYFIDLVRSTPTAVAGTSGPWGDVLVSLGTDFWVGVTFATANEQIDRQLEEKYPYEGGDFELTLTMRALEADLEFRKQNCHLIIR